MQRRAILLIESADQKGLVAGVSQFLYEHQANILEADQHQDHDENRFFMRIEWDLRDFDLSEADFPAAFAALASRFGLNWRVVYPRPPQRLALFVSKFTHCLADLLHRWQIGELECSIEVVIGNHDDAAEMCNFYSVPFLHIPLERSGDPEAEARQLAALAEHHAELIVLARYMRVLSPQFVNRHPNRIINVHHSFLPAFAGAKPYHAAFERGVKLIGATSHYVTSVLDEGPIIEQDVVRISHRDQIENLLQKGRDLERVVLSRAIRWHLENRILIHGNKTIVFE